MAIAKDGVFIAPSTDIKTKNELNAVKIPSGVYHCTEQVSISYLDEFGTSKSLSSNLWTVICISSNTATNLLCYTQIWICTACQTNDMFVRTLNTAANGYTTFSKMVDIAYLRDNAVINTLSTPVELYVQSTSPGVKSGRTRVWIDTSS